jgi:hypothetical protein
VKPNEVYTDLEKKPKDTTSQLEMWCHIIQIVKMGIATGNIPIKDLSSRYHINKKQQ